jgi:5-formyltetrahydrofolate cyclo-ligase
MATWWEINKDQLRQRAKQTLAALSPEDKKQQSKIICNSLKKYSDQYNTWAVFIPFTYEPDIFPFVEQLRNQNKTVLIPQLDGNWLRLAHCQPDSIIIQWLYGEWIIDNPMWYQWALDVCLIPWLVFDRQWWRIGHGKWLYDRFLAINKSFRIGISYRETVIDQIPHDPHDQKMDVVIS